MHWCGCRSSATGTTDSSSVTGTAATELRGKWGGLITFAGVGSGTVVSHCEVAFNFDDGFEFVGGTVNVRYLSVLFGGDDSFDTDMGYQGMGQFLFTMLGSLGDHGTEMDSQAGSDHDAQPRSHPAFYSMTIIGGGSGSRAGELMHLKDGTGGKFGNLVLTRPSDVGIKFDDCGSNLVITQTMPASGTSIGAVGGAAADGYLYFSTGNIIDGATNAFVVDSDCPVISEASLSAITTVGNGLNSVPTRPDYTSLSATFDPTPLATGAARVSAHELPSTSAAETAFFSTVTCKGAFASSNPTDNWLRGWSWLDCSGKLAGGTCAGVPPSPFATVAGSSSNAPHAIIGGTQTGSLTLSAGTDYILGSQLFMPIGTTLTIAPGVNIYSLPSPADGMGGAPAAIVIEKVPAFSVWNHAHVLPHRRALSAAATHRACVIRVLQGATISASGTATAPITMTSILAENTLQSTATVQTDTDSSTGVVLLGARGKWGGLILPASTLPTGIDATTYMGAFGSTNWLDGWSIMNTPLQAGFVSSTYTCPAAGTSSPLTLCGDITTDTTW